MRRGYTGISWIRIVVKTSSQNVQLAASGNTFGALEEGEVRTGLDKVLIG